MSPRQIPRKTIWRLVREEKIRGRLFFNRTHGGSGHHRSACLLALPNALSDIGFKQTKLVNDGGQARYRLEIVSADMKSFVAQAVATVDFDEDGNYNVWTVDETGAIREKVPD